MVALSFCMFACSLCLNSFNVLQEADDNDYKSEESDSESTDSDFSIDENEEVHSDANDDDEPKRKKRVVTKAYKVWFFYF